MKGHQHVIDWVDQQEDESDVSDSDDWLTKNDFPLVSLRGAQSISSL